MSEVRALRAKPRPKPEPEPVCRAEEAAEASAVAMARVADELAAMRETVAHAADRLAPAADRVHDFAERLDKLCCWLRRWGPRLLWAAPLVITLMNGLSPEVAEAVKVLLERWIVASATGGG